MLKAVEFLPDSCEQPVAWIYNVESQYRENHAPPDSTRESGINSLSWRTMGGAQEFPPFPGAAGGDEEDDRDKSACDHDVEAPDGDLTERLGVLVGSARVAAVWVSESAPLRKPSFGSDEKIFK